MKKSLILFIVLIIIGITWGKTQSITVTGPITGGNGEIFSYTIADLDAYGYGEKEYFYEGQATAYQGQGQATENGKWTVVESTKAPFKTRMIVRKPTDAGKFNGTVIVEWLNVSAGADGDHGFMYVSQEILREGYAWVGVSAQKVGVEGGRFSMMPGVRPLKKWDTERYGSLSHPGDDYCYDIFTRAAQIIKGADTIDVLEGLKPQRLIGYGESQSAMRLVSFVNGVHPLVKEFDGFFIHSRGATSLPFSKEFQGNAVRIHDDIEAKVFQFQTEGDVLGARGYHLARQPNSDNHHCWEVAGTAHADQYILDFNKNHREAKSFSGMMTGIKFNNGPQHLVIKAALHAMHQWMIDGTTPPEAEPLVVKEDGTSVTDEHGNTLGGVRTPAVEVPISTLKARPEPASSGVANIMSGLFGQTIPFTPEKLLELYPTHEAYVLLNTIRG